MAALELGGGLSPLHSPSAGPLRRRGPDPRGRRWARKAPPEGGRGPECLPSASARGSRSLASRALVRGAQQQEGPSKGPRLPAPGESSSPEGPPAAAAAPPAPGAAATPKPGGGSWEARRGGGADNERGGDKGEEGAAGRPPPPPLHPRPPPPGPAAPPPSRRWSRPRPPGAAAGGGARAPRPRPLPKSQNFPQLRQLSCALTVRRPGLSRGPSRSSSAPSPPRRTIGSRSPGGGDGLRQRRPRQRAGTAISAEPRSFAAAAPAPRWPRTQPNPPRMRHKPLGHGRGTWGGR
ncbi:basic salivary proline-rich protein 2-like [Mustela putorius furo]|uniref:Basic salivary proline-rich protein 2-like n=1 Tax=Mustela putorius furo TaxID=9669 RepID=A0A8U0RF10_MUSPF|nr:basic salivary proline-rich protein 2-like [Mustela putorius furo]